MHVEKSKRLATAIHHSSTHLLHAALKKVLGEHVQQKGSLVDETKLRFDFSHSKPLSKEEIVSIEVLVNEEVLNNVEVSTKLMKLDDAIDSGAQALFGEKYDDDVRVLSMGADSFSVELCGGTHVKRTGDIGVFVITNQSSVASGIRRVEALAGKEALAYLSEIRKVNSRLQETLNIPIEAMRQKSIRDRHRSGNSQHEWQHGKYKPREDTCYAPKPRDARRKSQRLDSALRPLRRAVRDLELRGHETSREDRACGFRV